MISFIIASNKTTRIFYFIKTIFFEGYTKAFYYLKLYRSFLEKDYKNFFLLSKKRNIPEYNKTYFFNKLCIEYLHAILFKSFQDAAKLRLMIEKEIISNTKFKILTKSFYDLNFNKKKIFFKETSKEFKEFLKNKEVVFIGPAIGEKIKIKKNQIIITTNITNDILKYRNNKKVSYFSNRRVNFFTKETISKIEKCDFSILKSKSSLEKLNLNYQKIKLRVMNENKYYVFGSPMMLQLVLIDLLNHGASKIFLKNFDLYTTKNSYRKNYRTQKSKSDIRIRTFLSLRIHDALSNFIFIKNLYLNFGDKIVFDKKLVKILNLNLINYAKILDINAGKKISFKNNNLAQIKKKNEKY